MASKPKERCERSARQKKGGKEKSKVKPLDIPRKDDKLKRSKCAIEDGKKQTKRACDAAESWKNRAERAELELKNLKSHGNEIIRAQMERYQQETEQHLARMNGELENTKAELIKIQKELRIEEGKNAKIRAQLLEIKQNRGEVVTGQTHCGLESEYKELFTTRKRTLLKAVQSQRCEEILGKIFYNAYSECRAVVCRTLFQELYRPHKDGDDMEAAKLQAMAYGELLKNNPMVPCDTEQILMQVERHLPQLIKLRAKPDSEVLEGFLRDSVALAWKMVTINPPMILDQPQEFDDNLHERKYGEWNPSLPKTMYELVYFTPVLYNSYRDNTPVSKGGIGNKPIDYSII